jgi:hypothetical protein
MLRFLPPQLPMAATLLASMMWPLGCAQAVAAEPVLRCPDVLDDPWLEPNSRTSVETALSKEPAIFLALLRGDLSEVQRVLAAHPSLKVCALGDTPLTFAAANGAAAISLLLDSGAPIDTPRDQSGRTALHVAVNFGHFDAAYLLLKRGANPRIIADRGATVLHNLVFSGRPKQSCCVSSKRPWPPSSFVAVSLLTGRWTSREGLH